VPHSFFFLSWRAGPGKREKNELDQLSKVQSQEQAGHPSRSEHGHSDGAVEERLGDEQKN
jgi:hypothetical protein